MCKRKDCLESNFISSSINSQVAPFVILQKSVRRPNSPLNVSFSLFQYCLKSLNSLKSSMASAFGEGERYRRRGQEMLEREEETHSGTTVQRGFVLLSQNIWVESKNQVNSGRVLNLARCLFYSENAFQKIGNCRFALVTMRKTCRGIYSLVT